jgi:parvulin-like peptidyl-prolyl isomerase
MKGGAEVEYKLEDLKARIGNSPVKFAIFAKAAAQYTSACPSVSKGGDVGEFGPRATVKEFDQSSLTTELGGPDAVWILLDFY